MHISHQVGKMEEVRNIYLGQTILGETFSAGCFMAVVFQSVLRASPQYFR